MDTFPCYLVREGPSSSVTWISRDELPAGDVLIRVSASSLNYKDALAARGHAGIVKRLPHVPGVDAAGIVEQAPDGSPFRAGDPVIVTGYELGAGQWGGWSGYVRVPVSWVVPLPDGLTLDESMIYGTAGFTAAQAVAALQLRGIAPELGEILVTGATGGVGSLAVALLAQLGYQVTASTGKADAEEYLLGLGASRVVGREKIVDSSDRPLLAGRWAGAVDTLGGEVLATIVRSLKHRGAVAACGLVAGTALSLTVYPFLLRGVDLAGIDSAQCPMAERLEVWGRLAGAWRIASLSSMATYVTLSDLDRCVQQVLDGKARGRTVVRPTAVREEPEV
jgi:putative YhdH/YhfP family quinone oxidoreductase